MALPKRILFNYRFPNLVIFGNDFITLFFLLIVHHINLSNVYKM